LINKGSLNETVSPLHFQTMNQITVLFVDDHPLIRKAWEFLLNQDSRFKVIGGCESGEIAVELSGKLCPDIIIMDIQLRGMSGIEAAKVIAKTCPQSKIIGLSYHALPEYAQKMIQFGAKGYLTKTSSPEEIFKALIEVHNGGTYICEEISDKLV
jgi:DNA-binding NarL/FixJ family response regulator